MSLINTENTISTEERGGSPMPNIQALNAEQARDNVFQIFSTFYGRCGKELEPIIKQHGDDPHEMLRQLIKAVHARRYTYRHLLKFL